ncbi:MAG: glycosyltransferase [Victivallales bacterium]|nr:glycosyltransferase [Victivallales bacterium]
MKLTIVTICWNAKSTLENTIRSVLQQTRRPDQYLFVDGGSTDGTVELLTSLAPELQAAGIAHRVIPQERIPGEAGIPSAWNQGIAQATGDIIALLNADDWLEPQCLETVEHAFQTLPTPGLVIAPIRFHHTDGRMTVKSPAPLWHCEFRMPVPHPGTFVHASIYRELGLYDTRYKISADYDFIWRCRNARIPVQYLQTPLVNMRLGGLANSSRALARTETLCIAREHSRLPLLAWTAWLLRLVTGR